jgi:hypothetical protein
MQRDSVARLRGSPVRMVVLPQVHGNFVPGTTRTLEDRPLVNTRTLNDVDECLRVIWNIADALHHAQPGVVPTPEEARGLSCEVGSHVSDHSSLPHVRPRKGLYHRAPIFFDSSTRTAGKQARLICANWMMAMDLTRSKQCPASRTSSPMRRAKLLL